MARSQMAKDIIEVIDTMDQLTKLAQKAKKDWQKLLKRVEKEKEQ